MEAVPALVTLHVWGVPRRAIPASLMAMGCERRPIHRAAGLRFAKLLGTGDGRTFTVRDADPRHWGLLATWDSVDAAEDFESSAVVQRWQSRADEQLRLAMRPVASKGSWAGRRPFGDPTPSKPAGLVAAITRARLRPRLMPTFWRAVPAVSARLQESPGLRLSLGIGEAPVGLQGTFSLWETPEALRDFAHRSPEHQAAIARTHETGWYSEELFARFAVASIRGSFAGVGHSLL